MDWQKKARIRGALFCLTGWPVTVSGWYVEFIFLGMVLWGNLISILHSSWRLVTFVIIHLITMTSRLPWSFHLWNNFIIDQTQIPFRCFLLRFPLYWIRFPSGTKSSCETTSYRTTRFPSGKEASYWSSLWRLPWNGMRFPSGTKSSCETTSSRTTRFPSGKRLPIEVPYESFLWRFSWNGMRFPSGTKSSCETTSSIEQHFLRKKIVVDICTQRT